MKNEIIDILNRSKMARDFYFKNQLLEDKELLNNLVAISKIEKKIIEKPFLKEILDTYLFVFKIDPVNICSRISNKDITEIREDFEQLKREYGIYGKSINFSDEKNSFKGFSGGDNSSVKDNFSNYGRDLNL